MKFAVILCYLLCLSVISVCADHVPGDNLSSSDSQDYFYPDPGDPGVMPGYGEGRHDSPDNYPDYSYGNNTRPFQSPVFPGGHDLSPREGERPVLELPIQDWQLPVLSTGASLIILVIMLVAGITVGSTYRYTSTRRAGLALAVCHVISSFLIIGFTVFLYSIPRYEGFMDPFISTMYATFGILLYLASSSLIQSISLLKMRPLPPLHQAHILFVIIAIILILSVRIPVVFSLPLTMIALSIIIIPGAAFSLISSYYIQKSDQRGVDIEDNQTVTHSLPLIHPDLPPSFPEKLTSKYHDINVIGSGGMAVVYRGKRNRDKEVIALKIPFSADETSGKTFLNEMSVWRDLSHPHIVKVTDQNIFPVPYVEMEYLPRSLKDITLPVPVSRATGIIRQIGSALVYAHEKGVIHRDIKPGNVLLNDDGTAKLTDWGLSRFLDRGDDTRNTSFSLFYATPEQLSPEQYGNSDQRTDIYQLGVLLYELICGNPPFGTQNIGELFTNIQHNTFLLPSAVNPCLLPFDEIIGRALKASPSERFQSVAEFLATLDGIPGE